MKKDSKIYIAGHRGMVGSAIVRVLQKHGFSNLIYRTHKKLNLENQKAVGEFFEAEKPQYVFLAAAKVGGILANSTYPAEFIYENLQIQNNIIHSSYLNNVKKLLFLGSSCIYPRDCPQPIKESYLLSGRLEPTNEAYALAKIAGIKMCEFYNRQYGTDFISIMPTNLYGPGDNFDYETSHALPALIRKFIEAKVKNKKEVIVWGTGEPKREFLYVDDLADASLFMMLNYKDKSPVNIGTGKDISIRDLAILIKAITGFEGLIEFDKTKPDGTPRKVLDVSKTRELGWEAKTSLDDGIKKVCDWYEMNNQGYLK